MCMEHSERGRRFFCAIYRRKIIKKIKFVYTKIVLAVLSVRTLPLFSV